jgi:transposase InsO family protein
MDLERHTGALGLAAADRQTAAVAPNMLDRAFEAPAPNRKWIADFTYVWTAEGWLYVAAIVDRFCRRVVGWSMNAAMTAQLVTDALVMAIWRRGKPDALNHGLFEVFLNLSIIRAPCRSSISSLARATPPCRTRHWPRGNCWRWQPPHPSRFQASRL